MLLNAFSRTGRSLFRFLDNGYLLVLCGAGHTRLAEGSFEDLAFLGFLISSAHGC